MPLYEYRCHHCEKVFEVMQKFSDPPLEKCSECQGSVSKLMSLSSFALKGSGWYTTDYKRSKSESKIPSKSESKSEVSSESKPEPKAESKSEIKSESKSEAKSD